MGEERKKVVKFCPRCEQPYSWLEKRNKDGHIYYYAVHLISDGKERHVHKCYLGAEEYDYVKRMHPEMIVNMSGMVDNSRYIRYLEDIIGIIEKIRLDEAQKKEVLNILKNGIERVSKIKTVEVEE